jgi:RecA/RadA recombinase
MARKSSKEEVVNNTPQEVNNSSSSKNEFDISGELIKSLNKELGARVAYNLSVDESPTHVKRWISTGSFLLDYILSNKRNGGVPEGRIIEISGPPSCHARGEKVLMFDGSSKNAEDIIIGDQLMGPDSTPRTVLNVVSGEDELFSLRTRWNDEYKFNSEHILALTKFRGENHKEISIKDYLNSSNEFKKRNMWFQPKNGIDYSFDQLTSEDIDPYILGVLIGDGSLRENRIELTTADEEIKNEFLSFCQKYNYSVSTHTKKDNKAVGYYFKTGINTGKKIDESNDPNKIRVKLRSYNLLNKTSGNKFIPERYKFTNRNNRLQILAGLIDTDGYLTKDKKTFEFSSKSEDLAKDVEFISRSLGFATKRIVKLDKKYNMNYQRVLITGPINNIPTRIARKQAEAFKTRTQHNRCNFKIESIGRGEFFGFTVDKDNLYLSSRFAVIHNCGKSHIAYQLARTTQQMGGLVVYVDTENATPVEKLASMGLDVSKRFVYCDTHCTEEVFSIIESTITKAKTLVGRDIPILVIWDSVAATSPKVELDGEYEKDTIGLQARVLSKGMRKITGVIGQNNVTLILLNQNRQKIGVLYGDPTCVHPETKSRIRRRI